jgi:alcohol dehydrogenase class IV
MPADPFTWQDGERTIRFGRGVLADAASLLDDSYTLLTTERAAASAPDVVARASAVHSVGPGRVDDLAGDLLAQMSDPPARLIVALGGGRVIDTAKAVAAATQLPPTRVAAIPTTLSAAEMTRGHRQARGAPAVRFVRPACVLNDPALCASQPEPSLAASAANALSHALEGPLTPRSSPVPELAARRAADLIAAGFAGPEPDRDALALGALLAGYTIDSTSYGLHHVLSQTLVREAGAGHGPANAALLPHSLRALQRRFPDRVRDLDIATADCLADRTGTPRLRDQGIAADDLPRFAETAAHRPDLDLTPPRADVAELLAIYEAAW